MNRAALKLPDQLLVRYFRQGQIEDVAKVKEEKKTRDIAVSLKNGAVEHWKYIVDLGWIPDAS